MMKKLFLLLCSFYLALCCASSLADPNNPRVVLRTIFFNGDITLELFPAEAPVTVQNFLDYIESGFYDGLVFHRAINNFMIQGGSFEWAYSSYPYLMSRSKKLRDPIINESGNGLLNLRGTISMALLSGQPESATSGFFINQVHNTHLDGIHCVFGKVLSSIDFIDWIAGLNKMVISDLGLTTVPYYPTQTMPYFVLVYKTIIVPQADWFKADFNYDGIVDERDLMLITDNWLGTAQLGDMEITGNIDFTEFAKFAKSWRRTSVWYREIPSDIDNSGQVNFKDFALFAQDWDKNGTELYGDLNLDGAVNPADLSLFAEDWLKTSE